MKVKEAEAVSSNSFFVKKTTWKSVELNLKGGMFIALWPQQRLASCLSLVMRKPAFCICENKDADQLRGNREADQRLCFRYIDSTIALLSKYEISSL